MVSNSSSGGASSIWARHFGDLADRDAVLERFQAGAPAMRDHVHAKARVPLAGSDDDDLYRSKIQVADLNRLAATLAVIQYKQLRGFYADTEAEYHSVYAVDGNTVLNADRP